MSLRLTPKLSLKSSSAHAPHRSGCGFDFFLCSGMREQEVMHSSWNDLDFAHSTVTVRWKPQYGWSPKAYKGREIPLPLRLITALKDARIRAIAGCELLFPTSGCKPKNDFL